METHDFRELVKGFRMTFTAFAMQATLFIFKFLYLFFLSWLLGDRLQQ